MAGAAAAGGARGFLVVRALTRSHSFSPSASHTIFGIVDNSSRVAAPGDSPRRRAPTRYDLVRTAAHTAQPRAGRAGVKTAAPHASGATGVETRRTRTPLTRREATAKHYLFRRGPPGDSPGGQPRAALTREPANRWLSTRYEPGARTTAGVGFAARWQGGFNQVTRHRACYSVSAPRQLAGREGAAMCVIGRGGGRAAEQAYSDMAFILALN